MKYLLSVLLLTFSIPVYAQNVSVPSSVAASALTEAVNHVNSDQSNIASIQKEIADDQGQLSYAQSRLSDAQADLLIQEQNITTVATMNPPLPPAVDYCNANPTNCVNWQTNPS